MKTPIELSGVLTAAYEQLCNEVANVYETNETLLEWERKVVSEKNRILTTYDPKELGANEASRNAKIEEFIAEFREGHRDAEEQNRRAKHFLELARIEVEGSRAQLRCLELAGTMQIVAGAVAAPSEQPTGRKARKSKTEPPAEVTPAATPAPVEAKHPIVLLAELAQAIVDAPAAVPTTPRPPLPPDVKNLLDLSCENQKKVIPGWITERIDAAIKGVPVPPFTTEPDRCLHRLLMDEMLKRDHAYRDPMAEEIQRHQPAPELKNPLADFTEGEIIQFLNNLPVIARTPEQEYEYQSLSAEMIRRNPAWKDPFAQEVTVPAAVEPEPALVEEDDCDI